MDLSKDIIQQFVEVTNQDKENKNGTTLYGTIKTQGADKFVILDGSDQLTPIKATTFVDDNERVTVMIKDHQAIVTGNITAPAARQSDVESTVGQKISEFDIVITETIEAQNAKIGELVTDNVDIKGTLTAVNGSIESLVSENVDIKGTLTAATADINDLNVKKLDADTANLTFATIDDLEATNIKTNTIESNFGDFATLTTTRLNAQDGYIEDLSTNKLSADDADLKYANIDFANINMASVEKLFTKAGIIKNLVVGDQNITGELVGVTIKGDLIEANTLVADKLVVKGSDGLYYKLNTDGVTVESEQTDYNSLNGSVITAKSITASKVMVDDLVAFDATIGGFKITENSIYSGVKSSIDNTTRGLYMDETGQIVFGDGSNFIKFFQDSDGLWKLNINANSISLKSSNKPLEDTLEEINDRLDETVKSVNTVYYLSTSNTSLEGGSWLSVAPEWVDGKYMWTKTITIYSDNTVVEGTPFCDSSWEAVKNVEARVTTAEQKILPASIVSTVKNSIETDGTPTFAQTSTVIQTANDVTYNFMAKSSGINLIKNSDFKNGTYMWVDYVGGMTTATSVSDPFIGGVELQSSFSEGVGYGENLLLKADTEYVYEAWIYTDTAFAGSSATPLYYWCMSTENVSGRDQLTVLDYRQELKANVFNKVYVHFKTKSGTVYFTPFIYGGPEGATFSVRQVSLKEAKCESAWVPNPSEIYEGSTVIDGSGVTIKNGALIIQNKSGQNVMSGDQEGNLALQSLLTVGGTTDGRIEVRNSSNEIVIGMNKKGIASTGIDFYKTISLSGGMYNGDKSSYLTITGNDGFLNYQQDETGGYEHKTVKIRDGKLIVGGYSGSQFLPYDGVVIERTSISAGQVNTGVLTSLGNTILNGSDTWLRTYGQTGWFNSTYGGGMYMEDYSWIRSHGSKPIYCDKYIRADEGFQVGDSGSLFNVNSTGQISTTAEAQFSVGTYTDPLPNTSCAIKVSGRIASDIVNSDSYRFLTTNAQITSRSGAGGGFDFWLTGIDGSRFTFDGVNMKLYKVVNGTWTVIAG